MALRQRQHIAGFDYPRFARDIQEYREYNDLNQKQLAQRIGYSVDVICGIEQCRYVLSLYIYALVCDACELDRAAYWHECPPAPKPPRPDDVVRFDRRAFGRAVREWRKEMGLTQVELTAIATYNDTRISRIEKGISIHIDTIEYLCGLMRRNPCEFWK